ncbi:MAG TPA: 30S ribosomal protein S12 methylthiotransferase RimO, partial [Bacteroidales bacterium]
EDIKNERVDRIMELQRKISEDINLKKVGKSFKIIIDRKEGDFWIGRTEFDSPEVDNEVLVPISNRVKIGNFYNINITSANEYDLFGELII